MSPIYFFFAVRPFGRWPPCRAVNALYLLSPKHYISTLVEVFYRFNGQTTYI